MKIIKNVFLGLVTMTAIVSAQDKKIKKADNKFNNYAFASAIESYENLVNAGYSKDVIVKNLGNANYLNANYKEAANWYEQLLQIENVDIAPEYIYRYAQTLKSLERYEESDAWMQKFQAAKNGDKRAILFNNNLNYLENIESNSNRYDIKNISINSKESDFAPSFRNDKLVFSSAREESSASKNIHEWNNKNFLNLYTADVNDNGDFTSANKLSNKLNRKTHESSTAFTKDGTTVYFTRNNSQNGKFVRDEEGISRLKVYKATLKNEQWKNIQELPFNGENFSVAHPTLNKDESKLYFASDMPGTQGESDIFYVDINTDGSFGEPQNLGSTINTEGRETFPYITDTDNLYFSSDGHPGLGGLDVFVTNLGYKNAPIKNIGKPINSKEDDFSFIFDETSKKGFFASNREGGKGGDDIYSILETKPLDLNCKVTINGIVKDDQSGLTIPMASITVIDANDNIITTSKTDEFGAFSIKAKCIKGTFSVIAVKESYKKDSTSFTNDASPETKNLVLNLDKEKQAAPIGTDLAKLLDIEPIYFDFDKSRIRKDAKISIIKVLHYLKEYPDVRIQVRSHTDSRANNLYNQGLSIRRAKATAGYLISQGISEDRVTHQGFGESELTNDCTNYVRCSEEEHQQNRRSEFIIVN